MKKSNSKTISLYLNAFLPPLLWAAMIFVLSNQPVLPGFEVSVADFILKKSGHVFVYAGLYFLIWRGCQKVSRAQNQSWQWWLPLTICLLYAISDEYHQSLIPHRYPAVRDVGLDLVGTGLAWLRIYRYI